MGEKFVCICVTTWNVFAGVGAASLLPIADWTVTIRSPVGAFSAIDTPTVSCVPSDVMTGGAPTFIPVAGLSVTPVAPLRFLPRMMSCRLAPGSAKKGSME